MILYISSHIIPFVNRPLYIKSLHCYRIWFTECNKLSSTTISTFFYSELSCVIQKSNHSVKQGGYFKYMES